jgi:DNA-binding TFAR19-related protein (PDSD5 family)
MVAPGARGTAKVPARLPSSLLRDLLIYQLTVEAKRRVEESGLSRRELARRLKTSVPQLYRLLDMTNTRKSINQLICLLQVLDCSVVLVVTDREAIA